MCCSGMGGGFIYCSCSHWDLGWVQETPDPPLVTREKNASAGDDPVSLGWVEAIRPDNWAGYEGQQQFPLTTGSLPSNWFLHWVIFKLSKSPKRLGQTGACGHTCQGKMYQRSVQSCPMSVPGSQLKPMEGKTPHVWYLLNSRNNVLLLPIPIVFLPCCRCWPVSSPKCGCQELLLLHPHQWPGAGVNPRQKRQILFWDCLVNPVKYNSLQMFGGIV